jgi:hypothetical protein
MENDEKDSRYGYMRTYTKYFSLTFQMVVLIILGGFGGKELDGYFHSSTPVFTPVLIIVATILSFYLFFKSLFSKK